MNRDKWHYDHTKEQHTYYMSDDKCKFLIRKSINSDLFVLKTLCYRDNRPVHINYIGSFTTAANAAKIADMIRTIDDE